MNIDFYAILPLNLVYEEKYMCLSAKAILLYALFLNRRKFSLQNKKFKDSDGVFIYYSITQISKHLRCSKVPARKVLNELEKAGLVKVKFQEFGLPLKIYVNDIRTGENAGLVTSSEKPQDKLYKKPYNNSNYNSKAHKTSSVPQEKQVSFDVENAKETELKHLYNFAEKTKKRRTRNVGPTL